MRVAALALVAVLVAGCPEDPSVFEEVSAPRTLEAYPNRFGPDSPLWAAQPDREKPLRVVASRDGRKAWVSLAGTADAPGTEVAVVDLERLEVTRRIEVGPGPGGMALHPTAGLLVVTARFANHLTVVDTRTDRVLHRPPVDFYATDLAFTPDGRELWIANRWRDAVAVWEVEAADGGLRVLSRDEPGVPVDTNPRALAVSEDGRTVAVAALTGLSVSLIDRATRAETHRVDLGAPANDVAFVGDLVVVPTLSASTHHLPFAGPDTDGDGHPGDGTPNVNFQDLQNEIAVLDAETGEIVRRYTSDTICCRDYRDVDPRDAARHGDLLTPEDTWIVGGALPEQVAVDSRDGAVDVWVTYSASNQVQRFGVDPETGDMTPGEVVDAGGHNPHGVAVTGERVLVVHRLGESLGVLDRAGGAQVASVPVGDLSGGAFPATDAELGELLNFVTAPFSVDGDQSCSHCHRENGNIDKAFSMPLTRYAGVGQRLTMAYRGAADTRPWFMESAMDEANFKPVINEFARIENFCCSDYTLWPGGTPKGCESSPPDACFDAPNPGSSDGFDAVRDEALAPWVHPRPTGAVSRDAFFLQAAEALTGRRRSFGDGLYFEDPVTGDRSTVALDFDGMTRALGLFLMTAPRLLPNPNDPDTAAARRGGAVFERADTGCATCHPPPTFAVSTDVNPFGLPLRMAPVVTPVRAEDGTNLDLFAGGFVDTFPKAEMDSCEAVCGPEACSADPSVCDDLRSVRFGVPSLRGIWDRADAMLHDGRARGLREVVCTPGHPALRPGETGFNERDGTPDTHGGTSHLTPSEIDDLVTYLRTL